MPVTRKMKADLDAKVSVDNSSEKEGKKRCSFKKKLVDSGISTRASAANKTQIKVKNDNLVSEKPGEATSKRKRESPQKKLETNNRKSARLTAVRVPQKMVKNGNLLPEKSHEVKSKKQKQDGVHTKVKSTGTSPRRPSSRKLFPENVVAESGRGKQDWARKKLKTHDPNSVRVSPRRSLAATRPQTLVKNGNLLSETVVEGKRKNKKEDGARKKVEPSPSSKQRPCPKIPQTRVKDDNSLPHKTKKGLRSKAQNDVVQENYKQSNPSTATSMEGRSQESSARKIKIMRSLGLIAPSGSPFG